MKVKISLKNSKIGNIASVSLPAGISCPQDAPCRKTCYAAKLERIYKTVGNAYLNNWELLNSDMYDYFKQIETFLDSYKGVAFRWHVSGDIPNMVYLIYMVDIAKRYKNIKFLAYTKNYSVVNSYLAYYGLPSNFHVIFSKWDDYEMPNPHDLPVAYVNLKHGNFDPIPEHCVKCYNQRNKAYTCETCAILGKGCYSNQRVDIVFDEH